MLDHSICHCAHTDYAEASASLVARSANLLTSAVTALTNSVGDFTFNSRTKRMFW